MDIINKRRSVRTYLPNKVEKEKIDLILRAAMQAPSAKNQQPWHFIVVEDESLLLELSTLTNNTKMFKEAPLAIVVAIDNRNLKTPLMALQDASAATMNILLKATDEGLGTCWCGVYPHQERMIKLKEILSSPDYFELFSLIAIGYPKNEDALHFVDRYEPNKIHYGKF